jgi:hypothetical protein
VSPQPRRDFPVPLPVEIELANGARRTEYAVNVSPGGLCVQVARPLPRDEELRVAFALPTTGLEVEAVVRVVWTSWHEGEEEGERFWETGLQFTRLDPRAGEQLLAYASLPPNRRR